MGFCILLLPLILQVSFGEELPLTVNIATDKHFVFPGDVFQYAMKISNNSNETAHNILVRMNMTGPGSISPNQNLNCATEKINILFCETEMEILPQNSIVRSFAVDVNPDASFNTSFSLDFEVFSDLINDQQFFVPYSLTSIPSLPNSDQAFLTAGWAEGKDFPPIAGQSFSMFILAHNNGPSDAKFVELHYRLSGPGFISKSDLPPDCFVFEDAKEVICTVDILPPEKYLVREIPIIVDSDSMVGDNFGTEVWVWAGSDNDPLHEYNRVSWDGLMVFSKTPSNHFKATTKLQDQKVEEQRKKTLEELKRESDRKSTILKEKEDYFNYISSTSDDQSKIIDAQKEYLEAKIDYLEAFQKYLEFNPATNEAQLQDLKKQISEYNVEYEKFVYEQIFADPFPPIPISEDFTNVTKPKPILEKESTNLFELGKIFAEDPIQAEIYAKTHGLEYKEGKTKVLVTVENATQITKLDFFGATIESSDGEIVQIEIPVSELKNLKKLKFVKKLNPPTVAIQTSNEKTISEGVEKVRANLVHEGGFTGNGITAAVLDLGFDQNNIEIKDNISQTKSFRIDSGKPLDLKGRNSEYKHGTAVAEIIVDVAPDVELYLFSVGTETEFAEAVDYAIEEDVDIIHMSMGWVNYPTDGKSTITKKTEHAIEKGISFVVSSGNFAQNHWEGNFYDSNGNGWHEFPSLDESSIIDEGITLKVPLSKVKKSAIKADLLWDGPNADKDFFGLILRHEGEQVDYSSHVQPQSDDKKVQSIFFVPQKKGIYELGVYSELGESDSKIEIFSSTNRLEHVWPEGSVGVPTDARGAIVTGAVNHENLSPEPYSSQGPTNLGNEVPTVVAPSGVKTTAKGFFSGTSASAPHVAGIIALMLEKYENSTPSEIKKLLETNALPLNSIRDNIMGFGKADSGFLIKIPNWIKMSAADWAKGKIDDQKFIEGIEELIKNEIILLPKTQEGFSNDQKIPNWIKNNAGWWAEGTITDNDFIKGIQYLLDYRIILV